MAKTLIEFYCDLYDGIFGNHNGFPFLGAVFSNIYTRHSDLDFLAGGVDQAMDVDYILNKSGRKIISPMLYEMLYGDFKPTPPTGYTSEEVVAEYIGDICYNTFGEKWKKQFAALNEEYNPLENYNMNEKVIDDTTTITFGKQVQDSHEISYGKTVADQGSTSHTMESNEDSETGYGKTVQDSRTITFGKTEEESDVGSNSESETVTPGITTTNAHDVYAYNQQSTASHADKTTESRSGSDSRNTSGSDSKTRNYEEGGTQDDIDAVVEGGSDTITRGVTETGSDSYTKSVSEGGTDTDSHTIGESGDEVHDRDYEFTRTGNIGVTTSQQMLEQEWEIRKHLLLAEMMSDVDKILTLSCY